MFCIMFWIIILLSVLSVTSLMEKDNNYQEGVLKGVSLFSINSSSTGVPIFVLKMDLERSYPMCYPNASEQQLVFLSLTICKQLGFDSLNRFYPMDTKTVDLLTYGKGLHFSANCSAYQHEQFCLWRFLGKVLCKNYFGIDCAECNYAVEVIDGKKQEIILPDYFPCFIQPKCEWKIINKNPTNKVTVLEFHKEPEEHSEVETDSEQIIIVKWFDLKLNKWTAQRTTISQLDEVDPIKATTKNISVSYITKDCELDYSKRIKRHFATLKYYNEEISAFSSQKHSDIIWYILCGIFLLALILAIISCSCCYIKKQKNLAYSKHTGIYSMTYIPGLNVSYDEDYLPAFLTENNQQNSVLQNGHLPSQKQQTQIPEVHDEVSNGSCKGIQSYIRSLKTVKNVPHLKKKSCISSLIEAIVSCGRRKSDPSYLSELLMPACSASDELEDSSLQQRFKIFDKLVLSFQWSDSGESVSTTPTDENKITDSNLAFFSGQPDLRNKNEQLKTLVSELASRYRETSKIVTKSDTDDDMFSCVSGESPRSYYSIQQSRRTSRAESFISTISEPHSLETNMEINIPNSE